MITLDVVTTADVPEAEKGFFSSAPGVKHSVQSISVAALGERLEAAMRAVSEAITRAAASTETLQVERAEISLEITAKGEVRLIASGSLETKGAIKLTIVPRR
jgi:hypothetical protein